MCSEVSPEWKYLVSYEVTSFPALFFFFSHYLSLLRIFVCSLFSPTPLEGKLHDGRCLPMALSLAPRIVPGKIGVQLAHVQRLHPLPDFTPPESLDPSSVRFRMYAPPHPNLRRAATLHTSPRVLSCLHPFLRGPFKRTPESRGEGGPKPGRRGLGGAGRN